MIHDLKPAFRMNRFMNQHSYGPFMAVVFAVATLFSSAMASGKEPDKSCRSCHDRLDVPHAGLASPHAGFDCQDCHRHALSPGFHRGGKSVVDLENKIPTLAADEIRLSEDQVFAVHKQCQSCHAAEFKQWTANRHALNYRQSFLNPAHNKMEPPINDCLRCHAMFFPGAIGDLVTPLNNQGPWKMKSSKMARHYSMPCLSCHQVHPAAPAPAALPRYASQRPAVSQKSSPFVGFYDRREKSFFPLSELPHPKLNAGETPVKISGDLRIRNCYQCHAPDATHGLGTSDDKTPRGVHAGLSCLDCHGAHALSARNSCAQCHPEISHCKLEVTRMDTSFRSSASKHDIHRVACQDCHPSR